MAQYQDFNTPEEYVMLSEKEISLDKRYQNETVNRVFKDNILLTLHYLNGTVKGKDDINWDEIGKPLNIKVLLKPGEVFAFHDQLKKEYQEKSVIQTHAHFNFSDGFKTSGSLYGDGVCHLASLIYWAAKDAGLEAVSPVNHDFANIPQIPKEYGVSIYSAPGNYTKGSNENLYITNNQNKDIEIAFAFNGDNLNIKILKEVNP